MAKFVIAGSCDCPHFTKLELLADQLAINLPHFQIHKIIQPAEVWESWLQEICTQNGWKHTRSPIVWRELVDRGGKGILVGGANEFMEYAQCYYGFTSNMMTDLMMKIREENIVANAYKHAEEEHFKSLSKSDHICIVNASHPVAYHFIPRLASGEIFGTNCELSLQLCDKQDKNPELQGICLETEDLAYPLLRGISLCNDVREACRGASAIIFLEDESSESSDETRAEFISRKCDEYKSYAQILNTEASQEAKVIVSGNGPINFLTFVLAENATNLNKRNIVAASRLQERRARTLLAEKLKVIPESVKNVVTWGNCAHDASPDSVHVELSAAIVKGYDGAIWGPEWFSRPLLEIVYDNKWISEQFVSDHQERKKKLEMDLRHGASLSEAAALSSLLRDWMRGASSSEELFSLGVYCEGWYDVSECVMSLPVRFTDGSYQVVWDMNLNDESKTQIKKIETELKKDIRVAFPVEDSESQAAFGEESELISSMLQQPDTPAANTGDKLEAIKEEDVE